MKIETMSLLLTFGSILLPERNLFGQQATNQLEIKAAIISIQEKIVDLTNPLEPFTCKEFVSLRKSISKETGRQIVRLIKNGELTTTQSEIGIGLLSGLPETDYWVITAVLLSPKTPEEILNDVLGLPFPYGPCFANAYTHEIFKAKLLGLKTDKVTSKRMKDYLDFILFGEAAKTYRDYLKHPDRYGYSPIQQ